MTVPVVVCVVCGRPVVGSADPRVPVHFACAHGPGGQR